MRISFHGAVREVTGSCFLLEAGGARILIDCGMFQGERYCDARNLSAFTFDPKSLDAVFITHPHADHTGRLPRLVRDGYRGPIYFLEPAKALTQIILEDAYEIMLDNAKRCGHDVLYDHDDVVQVMEQAKGIGYHHEIAVKQATAMLHDAGHILGSSYVSIRAEDKTLIFSGDIGNDDTPILPDTERISHADVVVCESTYGHRRHENAAERYIKLKAAVVETLQSGGVLLIPAFSIERTQEVLYYLDEMLQKDVRTKVPIFLDSPMAIRATQVYRDYKSYLQFDRSILTEPDRDFFSFPNLHETLDVAASRSINDAPSPKVIIAGSGMMSGGRILHHLRRYLPDPRTTLLIIGYQSHGTIGRKLYEGAKEVHIFNEKVQVHARVVAIGAFSAHGDMDKLTRWLHPEDGQIPKKIILVHGDPEAKEVFATHLRHQLGTEVLIPGIEETLEV